MHNWIIYWILLLNITANANSILQDTTLLRQQILIASQQKDTLFLQSNVEKYAFYGNDTQKTWAYTHIATFYLLQKQPHLTIKYAQKALKYAQEVNKAQIFYLLQSAYFLQSQYNLSDLNRDCVVVYASQELILQKSLFTYTLSQLHQYEWKQAQKLIKTYFKDSTLYWDSIFKVHTTQIRLKSVKKAIILSYILPGLGQVYSGKILHGLTSFVLVFGLGFFLYYTIKNKWYLLGYFMVFGIFRRFFLGGAKFAEKQIYFHNAQQNEQCVKRLKYEIEKVIKTKYK